MAWLAAAFPVAEAFAAPFLDAFAAVPFALVVVARFAVPFLDAAVPLLLAWAVVPAR